MQYDATDAIVNSIIAQRIVTLYAREQYISTSWISRSVYWLPHVLIAKMNHFVHFSLFN